MNKIKYLVYCSIILALIMSGCSEKAESKVSTQGIPVKLSKVIEKSISFPIHTSGILANSAEMKLSFKIGGIISRIKVEEGQKVVKGQLLAKLKQNEIRAGMQQAESGYEKSQRDFQRVKKLYEDNVATLEQMQNAETAMDVAKANFEIAKFNLRHSSIYAPVAGKILMRFGEENEMIGPGNPVFILGSTEKAWIIKAAIVDKDILKVEVNDPARITFDAYPEKIFNGMVQTISGTAHPATGLFEIEISLERTETPLFSGFIGKIKILPKTKIDYKVVPVSALSEGTGTEANVYVQVQGTDIAEKRLVKIAALENNLAYISEGLEGISEVISEGTPYLTDKATIEIIDDRDNRH